LNKKTDYKKNQPRKAVGNAGLKSPWYSKLEKFQVWIIFIFAVLLYANTVNYGYVLDDGLMIKANNFTLKGFGGIGDIMTHDQFAGVQGSEDNAIYQGGRYRPLSQVTFAIEYGLYKLNPTMGHLINILMYGLLAVLIFYLLREIFKFQPRKSWFASIPFIATMIFIAHPLHTEVVANIKSRDEIMCMIGGVMVLFFSLKYLERGKITDLILSFVFFLFGIFSKESAITYFALVPLTIFVFRKASVMQYLLVLSPLFIASVIYFCIRFLVVGNTSGHAVAAELFHNPFMYATTAERYATIMFTWLKYLTLLIFPHPLTHDYYPKQIPIIGWGDLRAIVPLIFSLAIIGYAVIKIWKKDFIAFGILFFIITFSVTSNLVFDLGLFMNERFMFTPLLGFAIVAAVLLVKIKSSKAVTSVLVLMMLFYSVKTISRNTAWKSDFTLFTTDVKTSVNSGRCNVIAGSLILNEARKEQNLEKQKAQYRQSEEYLKRGLDIYADNLEGWNCLGEVQIYLGEYTEAVASLKSALNMDSLNFNAMNNLLFIANQYEENIRSIDAIKIYRYLIHRNPSEATYWYSYAQTLKSSDKLDSAITVLQHAISLKPDYYDAYNRIAEYYGQYKMDYESSIKYLDRAYQMNPTNKETLENLGVIYGIKADYKKSLSYFEKAYLQDSLNPQLCTNIGKTYEMLGDKIKANSYYTKAAKYAVKK